MFSGLFLVSIVSPVNLCTAERADGVKGAWLLAGPRMGMVSSGNPYSIKGVKLL